MSLVAVFLAVSSAIAGAAPTVVNDVRYRETPDVEAARQSLDIYAPAEGDGHPVLVYVHGGGWRTGDKAKVGRKPEYFTGRGWVFVSVNYRLLPAGRHPANVDDVAAAIAWVHDHIAEHGGDPSRIAVMGHSAGAHLAALVATDSRPLERAGKPLTILCGAVPLDTVAYAIRGPDGAGALEGHAEVFGPDPDVQRDASPQTHVRRDAGIPPFLICYTRGNNDELQRRREAAEAFGAALRNAGVSADVIDASDRTHREINDRLGDPDDDRVTGRVAAFLDRCVARPSAASARPLPRVLLIGDHGWDDRSPPGSTGYAEGVAAILEDRADIVRATDTGVTTAKALKRLDECLGDGPWDVIHFSFGLHDMKLDDAGQPAVTPEEFSRNLEAIVLRLEETGASLVWAPATPVPAEHPRRRPADIAACNAIAKRIMDAHGIPIDDLHAAALPHLDAWQVAGTPHFNAAGAAGLARHVAAAIEAALACRAEPRQETHSRREPSHAAR